MNVVSASGVSFFAVFTCVPLRGFFLSVAIFFRVFFFVLRVIFVSPSRAWMKSRSSLCERVSLHEFFFLLILFHILFILLCYYLCFSRAVCVHISGRSLFFLFLSYMFFFPLLFSKQEKLSPSWLPDFLNLSTLWEEFLKEHGDSFLGGKATDNVSLIELIEEVANEFRSNRQSIESFIIERIDMFLTLGDLAGKLLEVLDLPEVKKIY